jgi:hypothetical protein
MSFKNDHNKLKNYEILIKNERQKTQMAEKRVIELKKEIEHLLKSNKNNNNIKHRYIHNPKKLLKQNKLRNISMQSSFDKKGKTSESENENLNIFINDLHNQVNKLNNELNENENINDIKINKTNILEETKNNNTSISNNEKNMPEIIENNYLKNSNDISYAPNQDNKNIDNEKINNNKNRIYTIPEEMNTYTLDNNNYENNRDIYNNSVFDKMKGSDIKNNYQNYISNSNIKQEKNSNYNFWRSNNYSYYDSNNDINI